jgi:hypothetical protein
MLYQFILAILRRRDNRAGYASKAKGHCGSGHVRARR